MISNSIYAIFVYVDLNTFYWYIPADPNIPNKYQPIQRKYVLFKELNNSNGSVEKISLF